MGTRIIFALLVLLTIGCKVDERERRSGVAAPNVKNVKIIVLNEEKSKILYGDTLHVKLEFEQPSPALSVVLKSDRNAVEFEETDSLVYSIPTTTLGGGYQGLRAEVMLADSSAMRGSSSVRVVLPEKPPEWGYRLIETYPHDKDSYTQGLLYHNGMLLESSGRYGMSDIRRVKLSTGEVLLKKRLEDEYFAEGLAAHNDELFQLTWQENQVLVYDLETLERKRSFESRAGNGEGWGLCHDGNNFILSDGSADLTIIDSKNWAQLRQVRVFDNLGDVLQLNELEYVAGKIYANILHQERIAVIDPKTGAVLAYWNFEGILDTQNNVGRVDVMNGIAYRSSHSSFLVTGKLWPYLFEVAPVYNGD